MTTLMQQHLDYLRDLERRLQTLESEFQGIAAKAESSMPKPSKKLADLRKTIDEKSQELRSKVTEAREAGDSAWDELKKGIESAWTDLNGAFDRAREEFKEQKAVSSKK